MNPSNRRCRTLGLGIVTVLLCGAGIAGAATYTVTNTNDSGAGSLRQALADVAGSAGADMITFNIPGSGVQTITLSSELAVGSDVTIDGTTQPGYAGSNLINVSGNNASQVFSVTAGTVGIKALTITGGSAPGNRGGGVWSAATLTLTNCTISGNSAAWGAGLCNEQGTLTLTGCTVSGNTATLGAGIMNLTPAPLTMTNCTVSGNSASNDGGGISCAGNVPSPLTLTNCTISSNTAGGAGGGILNGGALTLTCCTFSGNSAGSGGGGVYNLRTLTLSNSIVANSAGGDVIGTYTDSGFNIVEDGSGVTHFTSRSGDPLLGPLANNGGPTLTHALLPGSPAVNAGNCAAYTVLTDQRGIARPIGSTCDIGAYEYQLVPTTTALTISSNPSVFGQPVTFTATVATTPPGARTPTGTVIFYWGAIPLGGAVTLNAAGAASINAPPLSPGYCEIRAEYRGDAYCATSLSPIVPYAVNKGSTTTTLTSSANPALPGQMVTFTAKVSAVSPAAGTPTGTVTFSDGATTLGTVALAGSGQATFSTSSLTLGDHPIKVAYSGDSNFNASTSAPLNQTVRKSSTTTLISSPNPSVFGQTVTLTATVTPTAPATGTPTGTVTFSDAGMPLGTAALDGSGVAALSTGAIPAGNRSLTAIYNGDATFSAATSAPRVQTVNQASTTTSLTSSPNPSVFGQAVTFTVAVAAVAPGGGTPTGAVAFSADAIALGTAALDASGTASVSVTTLPAGNHSVTAAYIADANFSASTSAPWIQAVSQASTTTAVTSSLNPSTAGQAVTLTATVMAVKPGAGTPTGTVQFVIDGANSGDPVALGGDASAGISVDSLAVGTHTVVANYRGDANFAAANGELPGGQVVNPPAEQNTANGDSSQSDTETPPSNAQGSSGLRCGRIGFAPFAAILLCLGLMRRRRS